MRHAVGQRRVDGVFGQVALDAVVVVALLLFYWLAAPHRRCEPAALSLHFVRRLPGADDHLADAAHGLAVAAHDADRAQVVQDVFGGDGFLADAALGKGQVFGNARVQVVADHQHVDVFVERVDGVGSRRVGAGGQHIGFAHQFHDVGRVAAARAFGVKGVDAAALEGGQRVFHKARFVEGVGVDRDLGVGGLGHVQAVVDGRWRGAPVLMQFESDGAGVDLLVQRGRQTGIALAQKAQVHGKGVGGLQHALDVPRPRRAGGGKGAGGRAGAAAGHGGDAAAQGLFDQLRANEMDVAVKAAGGDDGAFATDNFSARANDDVHARLGVGVAGLANRHDAAVLEADVGLDDAPVVDDQGVGHDRIDGPPGLRAGACAVAAALRLRHAVADGLAAAELDFLAVAARAQGEVGFDLDDQLGVGQAHPVAHGGAKYFCVSASSQRCHVIHFPFALSLSKGWR